MPPVACVPTARVVHAEGGCRRGWPTAQVRHFHYGAYRYWTKHHAPQRVEPVATAGAPCRARRPSRRRARRPTRSAQTQRQAVDRRRSAQPADERERRSHEHTGSGQCMSAATGASSVVALLGGLLAYLGSYIVSPTYTSTTQLLIRERDSTVQSQHRPERRRASRWSTPRWPRRWATPRARSSRARPSPSPSSTELDLDQPKPKSQSIVSKAKRAVSGTYKRAKAYVTHGFYAEPDNRDARPSSRCRTVSAPRRSRTPTSSR